MSEMWNSVAPGWEANAQFVDDQLALATEKLLDAAGTARAMPSSISLPVLAAPALQRPSG
jgi:hypothetical protein